MGDPDDRADYKEILGLLERKGRLTLHDVRAQTIHDDGQAQRVLDRIAEEGLAHEVPDSDPVQWARGRLPVQSPSAEEPG